MGHFFGPDLPVFLIIKVVGAGIWRTVVLQPSMRSPFELVLGVIFHFLCSSSVATVVIGVGVGAFGTAAKLIGSGGDRIGKACGKECESELHGDCLLFGL